VHVNDFDVYVFVEKPNLEHVMGLSLSVRVEEEEEEEGLLAVKTGCRAHLIKAEHHTVSLISVWTKQTNSLLDISGSMWPNWKINKTTILLPSPPPNQSVIIRFCSQPNTAQSVQRPNLLKPPNIHHPSSLKCCRKATSVCGGQQTQVFNSRIPLFKHVLTPFC